MLVWLQAWICLFTRCLITNECSMKDNSILPPSMPMPSNNITPLGPALTLHLTRQPSPKLSRGTHHLWAVRNHAMPLEYFNSLGAMMQLITFVVVGVVHLCIFKQGPPSFITQRQCHDVHKHTIHWCYLHWIAWYYVGHYYYRTMHKKWWQWEWHGMGWTWKWVNLALLLSSFFLVPNMLKAKFGPSCPIGLPVGAKLS